MGYFSYQLVQDFFHQQYHFQIPKPLQLVGLTRFGPTEAEEKQQSEEGGRPVEEVRFRKSFGMGSPRWFFFSALQGWLPFEIILAFESPQISTRNKILSSLYVKTMGGGDVYTYIIM